VGLFYFEGLSLTDFVKLGKKLILLSMYTSILTLHLLAVASLCVATFSVTVFAYHRHETGFYRAMLGSFGFTLLSGVGLVAVSAHGLGRLCAMMTIASVAVLAVRWYYRRQILAL
jgi:hypothetical protein